MVSGGIMSSGEGRARSGWDASLQRGYDREAEHYDDKRYRSAEGRLFSRLELRILDEVLEPRPGKHILDVPAGTGRLSVELARSGAHVVAGDISLNMLRAAASKVRPSDLAPSFAQVKAGELPFPDDTFDAVISFKFFHLVPNEVKSVLIRDMVRVLKPGGKLIIEFNSPFYGGVLAFLRYYFRKQRPGGMRTKCLFPDQLPTLFAGLQVMRNYGVKLPLSGMMSGLVGVDPIAAVNSWFGRLPGLKYACYALIVEARKPRTPGEESSDGS
jgi:ubiquinone/menaquinone biosynthesis C-methylase UbiE